MQEEELKELKATKALKETDPKKYEVCSSFTIHSSMPWNAHPTPRIDIETAESAAAGRGPAEQDHHRAHQVTAAQGKEEARRRQGNDLAGALAADVVLTCVCVVQERKWREEEDERLKDPEGWASQLRDKRAALLAAIEGRRRRKEVEGGRRGTASAKRMRALASAAFDRKGRARDDDGDASFGAKDSDWNVYRTMVSTRVLLCARVVLRACACARVV